MVSERWWKTLPQDIKNVILQAEVEAQKVERAADIRLTAEAAKKWEDYGVKVIRDPDMDAFRKVALSILSQIRGNSGQGKSGLDSLLERRP